MTITKKVDNPMYANDYHTRIACDVTYIEEETGEITHQTRAEINNDDPWFYEIHNEFGDDELVRNKNIFLEHRDRAREKKAQDKKRQQDYALFEYKSDLFDYNFIHNTKHKKIRRAIRKAQSIDEAQLLSTVLLMAEVFDLEPNEQRIATMMEKLTDDTETG